ncbi:MAG: hypothetical protein EPN84_11485 [Legionella sp.]|nr:MAG: hypothetical protein EPN84_11485 [Legionella sp.]
MGVPTFAQYVAERCKTITVTAANGYAAKGRALLDHFNSGGTAPPTNESKSTQMAYIHWYLIKQAFDSGKPFGKGMFNLQLKNEDATKALYHYFKGEVTNEFTHSKSVPLNFIKSLFKPANANEGNSYSRDSSHYRKYVDKKDGHLGIDKNDTVPLAWKFTTHVFGLNKHTDGSLSVYIKPETSSADLNKTWESIKHGLNLIRAILTKGEKLEGLNNYREKGLSNEVKEIAAQFLITDDKKHLHMIKKCHNLDELKTVVKEIIQSDSKKYLYHDLNTFNSDLDKLVAKNQVGNEIRVIVAPEEKSTLNLTPDPAVSREAFYDFRTRISEIRNNEPSSEQDPEPDSTDSLANR